MEWHLKFSLYFSHYHLAHRAVALIPSDAVQKTNDVDPPDGSF